MLYVRSYQSSGASAQLDGRWHTAHVSRVFSQCSSDTTVLHPLPLQMEFFCVAHECNSISVSVTFLLCSLNGAKVKNKALPGAETPFEKPVLSTERFAKNRLVVNSLFDRFYETKVPTGFLA